MFKLFSNQNKSKPFLVNDHPNHQFADLAQMPETQLVMLVPRDAWLRLRDYIENNEAVTLVGRFGAGPGSYEWEWIDDPEAVRWWRRDSSGAESLFGMAVAVHGDDEVELYGLVEVDEDSPHWAEVIPEEVANALPTQAKVRTRAQGVAERVALFDLYREYFRNKGMLTQDQPGEMALRRGTIREVERFRDALRSLLERADKH